MAAEELVNPFGDVSSDTSTTGFGSETRTAEDILGSTSSVAAKIKQDIIVNEAIRDKTLSQMIKSPVDLLQLEAKSRAFMQVDEALTSDLDELQRLRSEERLSEDLAKARASGSDEEKLKASQEVLRLKEFKQTLGDQLEAEQLAQRTLFRESQAIARQQGTFESGAQKAAAEIQNRAAQTGISNSSAVQGMVASIGTQRSVGVGDFQVQQVDISSDRQRLAANLTDDLAFLNETFDLGGDISAAAQSIANRQAKEQRDAIREQQQQQTFGAIGSIAGTAIGGPVGGAVGGTLGSVAASLF